MSTKTPKPKGSNLRATNIIKCSRSLVFAMAKPVNSKNPTLSIFQGLSTTMSDEEESWDGASGAFPVGGKSGRNQHHVFADEPFAGEYYSSLEIVQEGSKESTVTPGSGSRSGSQKSQDEFMTVSVASSETPGVNNTAEAVQQKQQPVPLGIQHSPQQIFVDLRCLENARLPSLKR